jgi:hypothetical protein
MGGEPPIGSRVYRAGIQLFAVVGVLASLLAALGVFIVVKKGDWTFLAVVVGVTAVLFLLLRVLRLEVGPAGFKYRNLSGSREVGFADVGRAYFEVVRAGNAPQGVAAFWVERRDGERVKVNLRTFPVEAAAVLFTALEAHGIQVEVPDAWATRQMAEQVRAAQAKLRVEGGPGDFRGVNNRSPTGEHKGDGRVP